MLTHVLWFIVLLFYPQVYCQQTSSVIEFNQENPLPHSIPLEVKREILTYWFVRQIPKAETLKELDELYSLLMIYDQIFREIKLKKDKMTSKPIDLLPIDTVFSRKAHEFLSSIGTEVKKAGFEDLASAMENEGINVIYKKHNPLYDTIDFPCSIALTELLLKHGAFVNVVIEKGGDGGSFQDTPLHVGACSTDRLENSSNRLEKVKLLLEHGADPDFAVKRYGVALSALDEALLFENIETINVLKLKSKEKFDPAKVVLLRKRILKCHLDTIAQNDYFIVDPELNDDEVLTACADRLKGKKFDSYRISGVMMQAKLHVMFNQLSVINKKVIEDVLRES